MSKQKLTNSSRSKGSFREQLEKIYHKFERLDSLGNPPANIKEDAEPFVFSYPIQNNLPVADLPLRFIHNYYSGYTLSLNYDSDWYSSDPIQEYSLSCDLLVNVFCINFSLLSIDKALDDILDIVRGFHFLGIIDYFSLLDACKVYTFLDHIDKKPMVYSKRAKRHVIDYISAYYSAINEYRCINSFEELNYEYPIVELCYELNLIQLDEFLVYPKARIKDQCRCYPVVPTKLFYASKFSITDWDFVDAKH